MNSCKNNTTADTIDQPVDGAATQSLPTRRDALKTVASTLAIGATGFSSMVATASTLDRQKSISEISSLDRSLDKSHWVAGHEGVLVFVDDWDGVSRQHMRAVSLLNTSSRPITLRQVNPGLLRADKQVFDLNHILAKGPVVLMPEQTRSFGLFPVDINTIETLLPAQDKSVNTLIHATPHTVNASGWQHTTQYAVIA